jgi:hypothetical protein
VQYAVLGAGLSFTLYLFFTLKVELAKLDQRSQNKCTALTETIAALRAELDAQGALIRDMQEHSGMLVPPAPTASGLNLNKRGQVLQMHRRGQSADQIATTLGLPRTEVDLLLKVHQIVLAQVG